MPIFSFFLASIFFSNDPEMFAGAILAGAVPTTQASSIIWTDLAGGSYALALILMAIMNLTGVLYFSRNFVTDPWTHDVHSHIRHATDTNKLYPYSSSDRPKLLGNLSQKFQKEFIITQDC